MFGRIRQEFECLQEEDQNSNVWNDKVRIPIFGRKGPELQYFEG